MNQKPDRAGDSPGFRIVGEKPFEAGLPIIIDSHDKSQQVPRSLGCLLFLGCGPALPIAIFAFMFGVEAWEAYGIKGVIPIILAVAVIIGIIAFLSSIRRVMKIDRKGVAKAYSFRGHVFRSWFEPIENYEGVKYWVRVVRTSGGKHSSGRTRRYHTITLVHSVKKRSVKLMETQNPGGSMRQVCEDYARQLQVPMLQSVAGQVAKRQPGDLDKTMWQLIGEGKIDIDRSILGRVPEGMNVSRQENGHIITAPPNRRAFMPVVVIGAVVFCISAFIVFNAIMERDPASLFVLVFFVPFFLIPFFIMQGNLRSYRLEISQERIRYGPISWGGKFKPKADLKLETIEVMNWCSGSETVSFILSDGSTCAPRRMGKGSGEWLGHYLMATVLELRPDLKRVEQDAADKEAH